jgi:hypothetical protein
MSEGDNVTELNVIVSGEVAVVEGGMNMIAALEQYNQVSAVLLGSRGNHGQARVRSPARPRCAPPNGPGQLPVPQCQRPRPARVRPQDASKRGGSVRGGSRSMRAGGSLKEAAKAAADAVLASDQDASVASRVSRTSMQSAPSMANSARNSMGGAGGRARAGGRLLA